MSRSHVRVRLAESDDVTALAALIESAELPLAALGARQVRTEQLGQLPRRLAELVQCDERTVLLAVDVGSGDILGLLVLAVDEVGEVTLLPVLIVS